MLPSNLLCHYYMGPVKQKSALEQAQNVLIHIILCMQMVSSEPLFSVDKFYTDNPLFTNTQQNDKICYNDNLSVTKP